MGTCNDYDDLEPGLQEYTPEPPKEDSAEYQHVMSTYVIEDPLDYEELIPNVQ